MGWTFNRWANRAVERCMRYSGVRHRAQPTRSSRWVDSTTLRSVSVSLSSSASELSSSSLTSYRGGVADGVPDMGRSRRPRRTRIFMSALYDGPMIAHVAAATSMVTKEMTKTRRWRKNTAAISRRVGEGRTVRRRPFVTSSAMAPLETDSVEFPSELSWICVHAQVQWRQVRADFGKRVLWHENQVARAEMEILVQVSFSQQLLDIDYPWLRPMLSDLAKQHDLRMTSPRREAAGNRHCFGDRGFAA